MIDHWMHAEPIDRSAWPDYAMLAAGHADTMHLHLANAMESDAHLEAAIAACRQSARYAWIHIFGQMSLEDLQREGF